MLSFRKDNLIGCQLSRTCRGSVSMQKDQQFVVPFVIVAVFFARSRCCMCCFSFATCEHEYCFPVLVCGWQKTVPSRSVAVEDPLFYRGLDCGRAS